MEEFYPTSEEEVEEVIEWALATKTPLEVIGSGSKRAIGRKVKAAASLHLERLAGILAYEPGELVISAWAGTPTSQIETILKAEGQHLAFEPPNYSAILGAEGSGTIGGAIASGFAGPRRISAGSVRDHILGLSGVTGRGENFKIGGRVVKNVTGYDLSKLFTGSFGTLGVMTKLTLKVLPRPETSRSLEVKGLAAVEALDLLRRAVASPFSVTGAAIQGSDVGPIIRIEGREDEIDMRMAKLREHLEVRGEVARTEASEGQWSDVRDLSRFKDRNVIWRINLPRAAAADTLQGLETETGGEVLVDWAGARIWLGLGAMEQEQDRTVRAIASSAGGKAMLFKAPEELKMEIPVFHPVPGALASLSARIRDAFDPERILGPGRMGDG